MNYIDSLSKSFEKGELDKIFYFLCGYFLVGYIILFVTYEQNFISLDLVTRILLSIGVSIPITTASIVFLEKRVGNKDYTKGYLHQHAIEISSLSNTVIPSFMLFYILKKNTFNYDNSISPFIALGLITFQLLISWIVGNFPTIIKLEEPPQKFDDEIKAELEVLKAKVDEMLKLKAENEKLKSEIEALNSSHK
ncbi:MAG: hypothetical protein O8C66_03990 [Candidatus Methanoperedens sp.]|nr:hypothetical protein [Candidatus Methanoperedens sp.]MCZ7369648.1 hypothetical protein [Candidatus Methanoperedens sp.]